MKRKTDFVARIALFTALSTILMFLRIPIPLFPSFYKLDLSESVVLIAAFALGPVYGAFIEFLKIFIYSLLTGSNSFYIGEFSSFLVGISLVIPSSIIYKKHRTLRGAFYSMLVGLISLCVFSCLINNFLLLPVYSNLVNLKLKSLTLDVNVFFNLDPKPFIILFIVLPFNLIKGLLNCFLTWLLYQKLSGAIFKYF